MQEPRKGQEWQDSPSVPVIRIQEHDKNGHFLVLKVILFCTLYQAKLAGLTQNTLWLTNRVEGILHNSTTNFCSEKCKFSSRRSGPKEGRYPSFRVSCNKRVYLQKKVAEGKKWMPVFDPSGTKQLSPMTTKDAEQSKRHHFVSVSMKNESSRILTHT